MGPCLRAEGKSNSIFQRIHQQLPMGNFYQLPLLLLHLTKIRYKHPLLCKYLMNTTIKTRTI